MFSISLSDVFFCAVIQAYLFLEVTKLLKLCSALDLLSISICENNKLSFFQFLKMVLRPFCSMNSFVNLQFIFFLVKHMNKTKVAKIKYDLQLKLEAQMMQNFQLYEY